MQSDIGKTEWTRVARPSIPTVGEGGQNPGPPASFEYASSWPVEKRPSVIRSWRRQSHGASSQSQQAVGHALDSELLPLKHLVAEPCCERLAQSRVSAIANPGDVSIGTHQYGGRCTDLAEYRKFPGAGIRGIDELNSVGPR